MQSHYPISLTYGNVDIVPGVPVVMDNPSTVELDLPTLEYDILTDLDIPGTENRAQVDARESESTSVVSTTT